MALPQTLLQATSFFAGGEMVDVSKIPQDDWAKAHDLCATGISTSWDLSFYSFGGLGLAAGLSSFLLLTDTPEQNGFMTQEELRYCQRYCKKDVDRGKKVEVQKSPEPPMWAMVMEPACW